MARPQIPFTKAVVDLDARDNKIINLGAPTADGDAVTKEYVDTNDIQVGTGANDALAGNTTTITGAQATAIQNNSLKVGITTAQAQDIIDNNAKVGITSQQADDIVANNAKVGITSQQATDIAANTSARHNAVTLNQLGSGNAVASIAINNTNPQQLDITTTTITGGGSGGGGTTTNSLTDGDGILDFTFDGSAAATVAADIGTGATQVAAGNHTHAFSDITGNLSLNDFPLLGSQGQVLKRSATAGTVEWADDNNTTYAISENQDPMLDANGDVTNPHFQHLELTGSDASVSRVHLGATQITSFPGEDDAQGAFIVLARDNQAFTNATHIVGASMEIANAEISHGTTRVADSEYLNWESLGGILVLNSQGLEDRFEDTYRKREIEQWVENDIPVEPKPAIQYYEVLGSPNFDAAAPVGAVDSERVEFSEFTVDLSLQRRVGNRIGAMSKAISFTLTETQASDNAGHWTIGVGEYYSVYVIKDDVYQEFEMRNENGVVNGNDLLRCVAFDPLSIPGVHDEQRVRIGTDNGAIYSLKLSELLNGTDNFYSVRATRSQTQFANEAITAIAAQTHFDGKNGNVHTLAFGTSQGHLSYVSQFINDLTAVDEYILDFDATDPLLPIPFDLRFPAADHATSAYPANTAKDNVWVREIKWIGQAAEFIAVGDHQASTRQFAGIPGDALGAPLIAYFRNIQATNALVDGDIHYLTTPFSELFFDNVVGLRNGSSTPEPVSNGTGADPDANDGTNLPTLNQLFGTAITSVIPITIGSQDWVYFFGKRDIHVNNQYSSSRAFGIKARLDGTLSIVEAINNHDATNGLEPIEGFIQWELVNVISEITGWQHGGSFGLQPLNHAQQRFNVQGGNSFIGLLDDKIIDIFGDGRTVIDLDVSDTNSDNSGEDVLTFSQNAEDDLTHNSNGWLQTDNIHGGWIGNIGDNININLEYQTLTIMGQSGSGLHPLYGISRYVVDLSLILRPLNGDPSITVGPIRVPDATGTKLVDNVLSPLLTAYNSSSTTGKVSGETVSVSTFDENYRVGSIEFSSSRDFDISVVAHDLKQVVNVDNDTYEFTLKYAQRFVAGDGDLEYELRYPRRSDSGNSNYPTIADEVTLFESDGTTVVDKSLYAISIAADTAGELTRLNIKLATDANVGLPIGTIVTVDYGYDSSIFYDFAHEVATSVDIMDQYYPGHGGSFQIPLGMSFADAGALTAYLVTKFTEILDEREVEVIQEGNSNVIEFRTQLRGNAVTDLILDDNLKFVIGTHNPVDVANPQVQGNLMVPRLYDGRSDFPGKFASTFDFNDAITETDFRSVLHQIFAQTGTASSGFNIPVVTSAGDEVINGVNTSLYEDDRLITESRLASQVITTNLAATTSAFGDTGAGNGSVDFINGTTINATGTTWDFNNATVNNLPSSVVLFSGDLTGTNALTVPSEHWLIFELTGDREYLLYNRHAGDKTVQGTVGILNQQIFTLLQTGTNPLTLVESDLPNHPTGLTTDTSKDYVLRVTDASGVETPTWVEGSGGGSTVQVNSTGFNAVNFTTDTSGDTTSVRGVTFAATGAGVITGSVDVTGLGGSGGGINTAQAIAAVEGNANTFSADNTFDENVTVSGTLTAAGGLVSSGDTNTEVVFTNDRIRLRAGGIDALDVQTTGVGLPTQHTTVRLPANNVTFANFPFDADDRTKLDGIEANATNFTPQGTSGISVTQQGNTSTWVFTADTVLNAGQIVLTNSPSVVTRTGEQQTFADNYFANIPDSSIVNFSRSDDDTPANLQIWFEDNAGDATDQWENAIALVTNNDIASTLRNAIRGAALGDAVVAYFDPQNWALYRVTLPAPTGTSRIEVSLTVGNFAGSIQDGTNRFIYPGGTDFDVEEILAYRDGTTNELTATVVLNLESTGVSSAGVGDFNGGDVTSMAYLAIQFRSTFSRIRTADDGLTDNSLTLPETTADYTYIEYNSFYENVQRVFIDRVSATGVTTTRRYGNAPAEFNTGDFVPQFFGHVG